MYLRPQRHDAEAAGEDAVSRVRRSLHFVPGASEKMLAKSLATAADGLILDLEDAVTPENKAAARAVVADWLATVDFRGKERVVRINPFDTELGRADVEATAERRPDAYLVPKVRTRAELEALGRVLDAVDPEQKIRLLVLGTETPQGLLQIADLPLAPRVDALTWGAEDLSAALGARRNRRPDGRYLDVFAHARTMTLLSACAAGVQPLDTVYVDYTDLDGLRAESREAAEMGFTGKMTIHPAQIEVVNAAFTPSAEEIAESRELLSAFEENRAAGRAAFSFRGQMVDAPHVERARRILDIASRLHPSR